MVSNKILSAAIANKARTSSPTNTSSYRINRSYSSANKTSSSSSSSGSSSSGGSSSGGDSSSTGGSSDSTSSSSGSTTTTSFEEVPVETYEEALEFANREWAKIKRADGHTIECKVIGSDKYRVGEWVHVVIPRFDLDDFMYITKASQSEDSNGDWTANLNLKDYPPSFGKYKEKKESSEEESEETTDTSEEEVIEE